MPDEMFPDEDSTHGTAEAEHEQDPTEHAEQSSPPVEEAAAELPLSDKKCSSFTPIQDSSRR